MSRDLIEAGLGWEYRRDRIAVMIGDPDHVALVTRDGPRVAGFAIMTFRTSVRTSSCSRYGRRTSGGDRPRDDRVADRTALVAGVASIHVELRATNAAAHAFYRSEGFTETLRVPGYYRGREAAVRMMRLCARPTPRRRPWRPPRLDGRRK